MKEARPMERIADILATIDYSLNTNKKRHIAGGILLSVSLLFAGLTFTVMTIKTEDIEDEKHLN